MHRGFVSIYCCETIDASASKKISHTHDVSQGIQPNCVFYYSTIRTRVCSSGRVHLLALIAIVQTNARDLCTNKKLSYS